MSDLCLPLTLVLIWVIHALVPMGKKEFKRSKRHRFRQKVIDPYDRLITKPLKITIPDTVEGVACQARGIMAAHIFIGVVFLAIIYCRELGSLLPAAIIASVPILLTNQIQRYRIYAYYRISFLEDSQKAIECWRLKCNS
jgi:hypothetical protein